MPSIPVEKPSTTLKKLLDHTFSAFGISDYSGTSTVNLEVLFYKAAVITVVSWLRIISGGNRMTSIFRIGLQSLHRAADGGQPVFIRVRQ
jgi:hypothetical protein